LVNNIPQIDTNKKSYISTVVLKVAINETKDPTLQKVNKF